MGPAEAPAGAEARSTLLKPSAAQHTAAKKHAAVIERAKSGGAQSCLTAIVDMLNGMSAAADKKAAIYILAAHIQELIPQGGSSIANPPAGSDLLQATRGLLSKEIAKLEDWIVTRLSKATSPPPPPRTYAAAARKEPLPEVVLRLDRVPASDPLRRESSRVIKDRVKRALQEGCPGKFPSNFALHGLRKVSADTIILQAKSREDAALIGSQEQAWATRLAGGIFVSRCGVLVVVHGVSSDFDAGSPIVKEVLHNANQHLLDHPSQIIRVRPLHGSRGARSTKSKQSIVITVDSYELASRLVERNTSVLGEACHTELYTPPPIQCFSCQEFGHKAFACPHKDNPSSIRCARCAGPHPTRQCSCNHCTDLRTCPHIERKCANCLRNGLPAKHSSFDKCCPRKIAAERATFEKYAPRTSYLDPHAASPASWECRA